MQAGGAFGLAALGTISTAHTHALVARGQSIADALTAGYQLGFGIAAACVAAGLLIVVVVLRTPHVVRARQEFASDDLTERAAAEAA